MSVVPSVRSTSPTQANCSSDLAHSDNDSSSQEVQILEHIEKVFTRLSNPLFLQKLKRESNDYFNPFFENYPLSVFKNELDLSLNVDLLDACKKVLSNGITHIIIRVCDLEGFGDHFFPLKLAEDLKKEIPNLKIAFVFEDEITIEKMKSVNDTYPLDAYYLPQNLPDEFRNAENGLCIGAASFYSTCKDGLKYKEMGLDEKYPRLVISEYGKSSFCKLSNKHFSSGLFKDEYGIFIDQSLVHAVEYDSDNSQDPLNHLVELKNKKLQTQLKPSTQSVHEYSQKTNLYFGYGHKITSQKHFIRSIAHLEKNGSKNVDMILILDQPEEISSIFDYSMLKELSEQGFGSISIMSDSEEPKSIIIDSAKAKTLKLVTRKFVVHSDFLTCLKMSQPLVMITGDQSLSEAISCKKQFIYECYAHKIALSESLKGLAQEIQAPLVYKFLCNSIVPERNFSSFGSWGENFHWDLPSEDYDKLATNFLSTPGFKEQWVEYTKYLLRHSITDNITPLIIRTLAKNAFLPLKLKEKQFRALSKTFF